MSTTTSTPRILSIQSHTVHGFVGNKAVTFPLQTMGFDVDCINTITLSNHPAYEKGTKGQSLDAEVLQTIFDGLEINDLLGYSAIMTGYTRFIPHLEHIAKIVTKIKTKNPKAIYICDPVLGDNEAYYVPSELTEAYQRLLLPVADVITPNIFESKVLSGKSSIKTLEEAIEAAKAMHKHGPKIVLMTGLPITSADDFDNNPHLSILISYFNKKANETGDLDPLIFRVDVPYLQGYYAGCGDLFSSLITSSLVKLTAYVDQYPYILGELLENCALTMTKVLERTKSCSSRELCIVESRNIFIELEEELNCLVGSFQAPARTVGQNESSLIFLENNNDTVTNDSNSAVEVASTVSTTATSTSSTNNTITSTTITAVTTTARTLDPVYRRSHVVHHDKVIGVIFDMDGTLTQPGAIDFQAMYDRNGFKRRANSDIIQMVNDLPTEEERQRAMTIIYEEEIAGMKRQQLRPNLQRFLQRLYSCKLRMAISTRNCLDAYHYFIEQSKLYHSPHAVVVSNNSATDSSTAATSGSMRQSTRHHYFEPVLVRESLGATIQKPNPEVARYIFRKWKIPTGQESKVWFLGDSMDDMKCGKDAGCTTVLIRTDYNGHYSTKYPGYVDYEINELQEFFDLIGLPPSQSS